LISQKQNKTNSLADSQWAVGKSTFSQVFTAVDTSTPLILSPVHFHTRKYHFNPGTVWRSF